MTLKLGIHMICPDCHGTGFRTALTPEDRRERARQIRRAKADGLPNPPLVLSDCATCDKAGYIVRPKGT